MDVLLLLPPMVRMWSLRLLQLLVQCIPPEKLLQLLRPQLFTDAPTIGMAAWCPMVLWLGVQGKQAVSCNWISFQAPRFNIALFVSTASL